MWFEHSMQHGEHWTPNILQKWIRSFFFFSSIRFYRIGNMKCGSKERLTSDECWHQIGSFKTFIRFPSGCSQSENFPSLVFLENQKQCAMCAAQATITIISTQTLSHFTGGNWKWYRDMKEFNVYDCSPQMHVRLFFCFSFFFLLFLFYLNTKRRYKWLHTCIHDCVHKECHPIKIILSSYSPDG